MRDLLNPHTRTACVQSGPFTTIQHLGEGERVL